MQFVVYGAGAIGGLLGAQLHAAGHEVVLVARGSHFEAIRDHGLRLVEPDGSSATFDVPVVDRIGSVSLRDDATVLLAMKSQDTELALRELAGCGAPEITVVCVQNGVDNERMALRRFAHVYGMVVMCPAGHLEPGVVEANAAPLRGILDLGRYPEGVDERAEALASALRGAGYLSEAGPEIMAWKYGKLLANLMNAVVALSGVDAVSGEVGNLVRAEAEQVLRTAGISFIPLETLRARLAVLPKTPRNGSNSSWQSLQRGTGTIEADFLNGEIVLLARLHGIDAPVNALVQRLADELARSRGEPGSVPADAVVDAVSRLSPAR